VSVNCVIWRRCRSQEENPLENRRSSLAISHVLRSLRYPSQDQVRAEVRNSEHGSGWASDETIRRQDVRRLAGSCSAAAGAIAFEQIATSNSRFAGQFALKYRIPLLDIRDAAPWGRQKNGWITPEGIQRLAEIASPAARGQERVAPPDSG